MNVRKHVLLAAPWVPVAAVAADAHGLNPWAVAVGVMAGSIASDADHPGSSAARMWGPVSGVLARVVSVLSGGHRGLTHGRWPGPQVLVGWFLLATSVVGGAAWVTGESLRAAAVLVLAAVLTSGPVFAASVWAFTIGVALTAVDRGVNGRQDVPWPVNLAVSVLAGVVSYVASWSPTLLAPGLILGVVIHLFGDRFRDDSRQARTAVAVSYLAVTAVVAWRIYPHLEGITS